ncbi:MAG: hypothetical protein WAZ98_05555 [Cyclobacteriaceae bacterium]
MNVSHAQDEKLFEYLDGALTGVEKEALEQLLQTSPGLRFRLEELRKIDAQLRLVKVEQPSKNFTQKVMSRLEQYPGKSLTLRNGVLLLVGVLVAVGIGSVLVASGVFDGTASIDLNQTISSKYIQKPLPTFNFNGKLMMNIIIMLNLALAFIVLDRTILKPWFERRRMSA